MRVIEPHQFNKIKKKRNKAGFKPLVALLPIVFIVGAIAYVVFAQDLINPKEKHDNSAVVSETEATNTDNNVPENLVLKEFTDSEFKELYTSFAYPNTQPIIEPPKITGNEVADARIRSIAHERGYKLSAIPVANIVRIDEPYLTEDDLLQQNAKIGWDGLQDAANKADLPLQITSAYRSIEFQRSVFLSRMRDAGITVGGIANGYSDAAVNKVMDEVAPPGFSRHHNGYTIDLACDGIGLYGFKNTTCYDWLSKNNFEIAKTYGWIPSYPEEAESQGPEPEPWEFIWVGTINLYE